MGTATTNAWPKPGEDRLLEAYRRQHAALTLFLEVGIGGANSPWPGSAERRIDGVAVATADEPGLFNKHQFVAHRKKSGKAWSSIKLLEAKAGLSEGVIGQLLAAKPMFEQHHELAVGKLVALYRHEDPAMRWSAEQLGIELFRVPAKPDAGVADGLSGQPVNNPMRARHHYRLTDAAVQRARRYRAQVGGGTLVTRVPIAGTYSGTPWSGTAAPVHVQFVHLPSSTPEPIAVFEDDAAFRTQIAAARPELVLVRRGIGRDMIGVAIVQGLLFEARYGVMPKLVIAHERPDAALEWVCREGLDRRYRIELVALEGGSAGAIEDELDEDSDDTASVEQ